MMSLGAVAIGGLIGSGTRAGVYLWLEPAGSFPHPTLIVNLVGSFLLGVFLARRERVVISAWSTQLWAIGVLGSFTTFSTFSIDVVRLLADGRRVTAAAFGSASVIGGLLVALLGTRVAARR